MNIQNPIIMHPTVFIIDDDDSVRKSLARLLATANIQTESYASAEAFLARKNYTGIGAIILDIRMPGRDGMQLHEQLIEQDNNLPIIFLSGHADIATSVSAMRRGAMHFLTKPVDDEMLLHAVQEAIARHTALNNDISAQAEVRAKMDTLTERELEILRYVTSGATNKQIARQLDIAEKTVKVHRAHVMEKLGAASIVDLVRACNLLDIEPLNTSPKNATAIANEN